MACVCRACRACPAAWCAGYSLRAGVVHRGGPWLPTHPGDHGADAGGLGARRNRLCLRRRYRRPLQLHAPSLQRLLRLRLLLDLRQPASGRSGRVTSPAPHAHGMSRPSARKIYRARPCPWLKYKCDGWCQERTQCSTQAPKAGLLELRPLCRQPSRSRLANAHHAPPAPTRLPQLPCPAWHSRRARRRAAGAPRSGGQLCVRGHARCARTSSASWS